MNIDFERNHQYTRSKFNNLSQQQQNLFEYGSKKPLPIQFETNTNNNNGDNIEQFNNISFTNKKDSRNDIQQKYNSYKPLTSTQHLPINPNNNVFFDNRPVNTRLDDYLSK